MVDDGQLKRDIDAAAKATMDLLRPRMQERATAAASEFFVRAEEYVKEDLGPALAVAGVDTWETTLAFLRMVTERLIVGSFHSAWGPTVDEKKLATDFLYAFLGHCGEKITMTTGEKCTLFVGWGERDPKDGPRIVTPDGR